MVGFGDVLVERVISHFGEEQTKKILHEDPYRFMDLDGIAFRRADDIAQLCGITDKNDPRRQRALIKFALQSNTTFGHVYLPMADLQKALKNTKPLETSYLFLTLYKKKVVSFVRMIEFT